MERLFSAFCPTPSTKLSTDFVDSVQGASQAVLRELFLPVAGCWASVNDGHPVPWTEGKAACPANGRRCLVATGCDSCELSKASFHADMKRLSRSCFDRGFSGNLAYGFEVANAVFFYIVS